MPTLIVVLRDKDADTRKGEYLPTVGIVFGDKGGDI